MTQIVQVHQLYKRYGDNTAVNGISFGVGQGEIFALLGTNGAGKTTTLECIEGLRKFDSGRIQVDGKIGVQLQLSSLPENIKVAEALTLFRKWSKAPVDSSLLDALGVSELKAKQYKEMSTGQQRRLHLALALIRNPDVVFLDEPTAGLDVEGRVSLHEEIRKYKDKGKTIIMASHDMAEVESLCDRIAILKDGEIAFIGTAEELTAQIGMKCRIHIKTNHSEEVFESDNIGETLLTELENFKKQGIAVSDVRIERATLEQRFMDIARGEVK